MNRIKAVLLDQDWTINHEKTMFTGLKTLNYYPVLLYTQIVYRHQYKGLHDYKSGGVLFCSHHSDGIVPKYASVEIKY